MGWICTCDLLNLGFLTQGTTQTAAAVQQRHSLRESRQEGPLSNGGGAKNNLELSPCETSAVVSVKNVRRRHADAFRSHGDASGPSSAGRTAGPTPIMSQLIGMKKQTDAFSSEGKCAREPLTASKEKDMLELRQTDRQRDGWSRVFTLQAQAEIRV